MDGDIRGIRRATKGCDGTLNRCHRAATRTITNPATSEGLSVCDDCAHNWIALWRSGGYEDLLGQLIIHPSEQEAVHG